MPCPVSLNVTTTSGASACTSMSSSTPICPPSGVYLLALSSRFVKICSSRTGVAADEHGVAASTRAPGSGAGSDLRRARRRTPLEQRAEIEPRAPQLDLPRVMRETSSRSSTSRARCASAARRTRAPRFARASLGGRGDRAALRRARWRRAGCAARAPSIARNSSLRRSASRELVGAARAGCLGVAQAQQRAHGRDQLRGSNGWSR